MHRGSGVPPELASNLGLGLPPGLARGLPSGLVDGVSGGLDGGVSGVLDGGVPGWLDAGRESGGLLGGVLSDSTMGMNATIDSLTLPQLPGCNFARYDITAVGKANGGVTGRVVFRQGGSTTDNDVSLKPVGAGSSFIWSLVGISL